MSEINIEQEYHEINNKRAWLSVYQALGESALRNRYRDVNPYDHSRVILNRGDTDYINANIVKHDGAKRSYILTQGPLPNTVGHFWLMVWEQNTKAIIMLNKIVEKNVAKCHMYWPSKTGPENALTMDDVNLKLEYVQQEDCTYYTKRIFKLTDLESDISRNILHFHYTTWPDFGVPSSPKAFLEFLKSVRESGALDDPACPPVIHCSAGIGRSGTFCLVDVCLVLIEQNDNSTDLNVQEILLGLRHYRTGLIQTADQLRFSYEAIIDAVRKLRGEDPNSDYEEVPAASDYPSNDRKKASSESDGSSSSDDEQPPPLPPPRGESLHQQQLNGQRSLSQLSAREIAERFITEAFSDQLKDASEYLINFEGKGSPGDKFSGKPLPAIPISESMDELMIDSKYFAKDNPNEENCPIGKPLPLPPRLSPTDDEEYIIMNGQPIISKIELNESEKDVIAMNNCNKIITEDTSDKLIEAMDDVSDIVKLDKSPLCSPDSETDKSSLRRRVRLERQTVLAEKVRDMKRKQQESERRANSKRFFLPIGLGLGGLCLLGGALYYYFRTV
ncbi:tyrosine-protein phosphatase non-receptor type 1-like [Ctenocephalides felis]|uniref:tyrosine-protein phosphatase non-receptor type 1-like n=1 Tax=Ctenocephalides felis TaxID=7515 RepID=UPI000E6E33BC|nr:tyrosine-protein phosphatase non-receptor type 1-like [Ctenocephalides felis]